MDTSPTPPVFNLQAQVPTRDIGEGYAKGITEAGKSISEGVKGVMDVMTRNRNADDVLKTLQQTNVLTPDQYNAIADKSLGAKESLTGMYANQWMLDQANRRAISLQQGQGGVEVAVEHAKMLDRLNMIKQGYPGLSGVDPGKLPYHAPVPPQPQPNPPAPTPNPNQGAPPGQVFMPSTGQVQPITPTPPPPPQKKTPPIGLLPGAKRVMQTDSTGKTQKGWQLPSGAFVADPGQ